MPPPPRRRSRRRPSPPPTRPCGRRGSATGPSTPRPAGCRVVAEPRAGRAPTRCAFVTGRGHPLPCRPRSPIPLPPRGRGDRWRRARPVGRAPAAAPLTNRCRRQPRSLAVPQRVGGGWSTQPAEGPPCRQTPPPPLAAARQICPSVLPPQRSPECTLASGLVAHRRTHKNETSKQGSTSFPPPLRLGRLRGRGVGRRGAQRSDDAVEQVVRHHPLVGHHVGQVPH